MAALQAGRIWFHLGTLYQDAGKYGQSELAFERAMRFLTIEPVSKAAYWGTLATRVDPNPAAQTESQKLVDLLLNAAPSLKPKVETMLAASTPPIY